MKKTLCIICLGLAGLAATASAATVELMPDIASITGQGYNSAGRLAGNGITAADVKNWLGPAGRADGWYTTTGNGAAGVCAGLKMTIENIQAYEGLTFSFSLTPPGTGPTFTYSLWYETADGEFVNLCKESRGNNGSVWNVSYNLTDEQMSAMKATGNGKVYAVLGSAGGNNGNNAF